MEGVNFAVEGTKKDQNREPVLFVEIFDVEKIMGGRWKINQVADEVFEIVRVDVGLGVFFEAGELTFEVELFSIHSFIMLTSLSYF